MPYSLFLCVMMMMMVVVLMLPTGSAFPVTLQWRILSKETGQLVGVSESGVISADASLSNLSTFIMEYVSKEESLVTLQCDGKFLSIVPETGELQMSDEDDQFVEKVFNLVQEKIGSVMLLANINISVPCSEESDDHTSMQGNHGKGKASQDHSSHKRDIDESEDDSTMTGSGAGDNDSSKGKGDDSGRRGENEGSASGDDSMMPPCTVIKKCAVAFDKETKLPITCQEQEMLEEGDKSRYLSLLLHIPSYFGGYGY